MRGQMGGRAMGQQLAQGLRHPSQGGERQAVLTSRCTSLPVLALGLPWVEVGVPYSFVKGDFEVPGL